VVLGGDEAAAALLVHARDVLSTISKEHLLCGSPGGECEELVSKTDTEDRLIALKRLADVGNGLDTHGWVTGTVADEETIILLLCEVVVPGNDRDLRAAISEAADLVVLLLSRKEYKS